MAKLEWRVSKSNNAINIADFMDTAFMIQFDGPGTFIAYQRDKQSICKERIREYRDAVQWCQEQADRMEAEANEGKTEVEMDPSYKAALTAANNFLSMNPFLNVTLKTDELATFTAELAEVIYGARIESMEEAKEISMDVVDDFDRDHDPESSSGAHSVRRRLERRIRILRGEDPTAVDRDMNK